MPFQANPWLWPNSTDPRSDSTFWTGTAPFLGGHTYEGGQVRIYMRQWMVSAAGRSTLPRGPPLGQPRLVAEGRTGCHEGTISADD